MVSRLADEIIVCKGGKVRNQGALLQGSALTGTALVLQNYEPSIEGGYRRINGYAKYDTNTVTGTGPILGVKVSAGLGEVFAARLNVAETFVDIYKSSGSGWTKINTSGQDKDATKYRAISYSITEPVVVFCDGLGPALKYNGTTDTLLNGTGAPADPKYAAEHLARLWLSGHGTGSLLACSAANDDEEFSTGAVEINVGDIVRGLRVFRGILYIFCKNSIKKLVGTTTSDFYIETVTSQVGCISADSIQEVGGDILFLSGEGLRSLAATERLNDLNLSIQSKEIQPELRTVTNAAEYSEDNFSSCIVSGKSQYRLFLYDPDTETDDAIGWLGRRITAEDNTFGFEWANISGFNVYCCDAEYVDNEEIVIHGDPSNGYVYRQERGSSRDGSNIVYTYRTPEIIFQNAEIRKVLHWIRVYTQVEGDLDIDLAVLFDFENPDREQPLILDIQQSGNVSQYGSSVYDTSTYSSLSFPVFRKNLTGSGMVVAFQISGSDTNESHRIDSLQIVFAPKGRR